MLHQHKRWGRNTLLAITVIGFYMRPEGPRVPARLPRPGDCLGPQVPVPDRDDRVPDRLAFAAYRLFPQQIFAAAFVPSAEFVKPEAVETSAYADPKMWFSRPGITGDANPSLWTPEGFEITKTPKVAVFYIHPTSYMKRALWNAPLNDKESQDRARIFLRSQASVFNGIGEIWAPRYRQAAIGAFLTTQPEAQMAFDAAYSDVLAAFDEFIAEIPKDMPIIIAGHSQGGLHLTTLMRQRVVTRPLADRIVAAYVIGWPVSLSTDLLALGLPPCTDPDQANCMIGFQSFGEPANPSCCSMPMPRASGSMASCVARARCCASIRSPACSATKPRRTAISARWCRTRS